MGRKEEGESVGKASGESSKGGGEQTGEGQREAKGEEDGAGRVWLG